MIAPAAFREILSRLDLAAEAEALGLRFAGRPNADGWRACRAIDREDRNPSAAFNVFTGYYMDHGAEGASLSFFDLAAALAPGRFRDWKAAKDHFAGSSAPAAKRPAGGTSPVGDRQRRNEKQPASPKGKCYPTAEAVQLVLERVHGPVDHCWEYHNSRRELVGLVLRWNLPDGKKEIRPVARWDDGWYHAAMQEPRPLYRLPKLPASTGTVYVCEGEKAADALWSIGLTATTSAGGSKAAAKTDWSPLAGANVVVLPDNDAPGRHYAETIAQIAAAFDRPANVRILDLPDLPPKGDAFDWINVMYDATEPQVLRERIEAFADDAPGWQATQQPEALAEWDEPTPLRSLPDVLPFDPDLLPVGFRAFAIDTAERTQAPIDYIAAALMVALGAVVAGQLGIRPKRCDDWTETTNLWGGAIGRPGVLKTPAIQRATVFLRHLEAEAASVYEAEMAEWTVTESVRKAKVAATEAAMKKAASKGGDIDSLARQLAEEQSGADPPVRRRYLTADATVEKLGAILSETERNILTLRDELTGWFRGMERPGHESARAFYLEAWSGLGSFTFDRIGRGTIELPRCIVSVFGAIQPGPLTSYFADAVGGGVGDDGLMQRFSLMVWPDVSKKWVNVDRWPDTEAKNAAHDVFTRLHDLDLGSVAAERDDHDPLPFLRFDATAQLLFDEWRAGLECRLRSGTLPTAIESHLAKYRKLVPALALLDHLADGGKGMVTEVSLRRALGWAEYLESHAKRIYASAIQPERDAAKLLLQKIASGDLRDGFHLRDVYRPQWSGMASRQQAEPVVNLLCDLGWLREERIETGGRPTASYRCHPEIFADAKCEITTAKTDESLVKERE